MPIAATAIVPGRGEIDLRYEVAFNAMGVCNKTPQTGDLRVADARVLYPRVPEKSILSLRMHSNDSTTRMPPLARNVVDTQGVKLIDDWIRVVASCL